MAEQLDAVVTRDANQRHAGRIAHPDREGSRSVDRDDQGEPAAKAFCTSTTGRKAWAMLSMP